MSLRRKILLPVVSVLLIATLVMALSLDAMLSYGVNQLEEIGAAQDRRRVAAVLKQQFRQLSQTCRDYAWWDDTVAFVAMPAESYIDSNFDPGSVDGLGVDLVLIRGAQGELLFGRQWEEMEPGKPAVQMAGPSGALLWLHASDATAISGIWREPDSWWMVVAHQIRSSGGIGDVYGTLIMARKITQAEVTAMEESSTVLLDIVAKRPEASVRSETDGRLHTWVTVPSINSDDMIIELHLERPLRERARRLQIGVLASGWILGLSLTLLLGMLVEWRVLRPIWEMDRRLRSTVGSAGMRFHSGELLRGEDEISTLGVDLGQLIIATMISRNDLEQTQRRTWALLDSLPAFVSFKDARGVYVTVNRRFAEMAGRAPHAVEGRRDVDLFPTDLAEQQHIEDNTILLTGLPLDLGEVRRRTIDGERIYTVQKVPIRDATGAFSGIVTIGLDVTDRRKAEASLEARTRFLANISHEIRTPMNGILGMVNLLEDTSLNDDQRDLVNTVRLSSEALLVVLNDLLDLAKVEAGKMVIERSYFRLHEELDGAVRLMRAKAEGAGLELQFTIGERVPREVVGDAGRLRQVLINLLSNAIKFTPYGGRVTVHVDADEEPVQPTRVRVRVKDTGIGIPADAIHRLFLPFSQVDSSTTRRHEGTGLGLAICAQLVRLMGGDIEVDSAPGRGSTFSFSLPFTARTSPHPAARPLRVLVADDNLINRKVAARMLERVGHTVHVAGTGIEAVQMAIEERPDIILMDVEMPEMDGLEATREIRARGGLMAIVALTASVRASDREAARLAGMDGYLLKPIQPQRLYDTLEEAMQTAAARASQKVIRTEVIRIPTEGAAVPRNYDPVDGSWSMSDLRKFDTRISVLEEFEMSPAPPRDEPEETVYVADPAPEAAPAVEAAVEAAVEVAPEAAPLPAPLPPVLAEEPDAQQSGREGEGGRGGMVHPVEE